MTWAISCRPLFKIQYSLESSVVRGQGQGTYRPRRGGLDPDHLLETVDAGLVRTYRLYPILAQHYSREAAFRQKIVALSRRMETQARDIFDLKLLLEGGAGREKLPAEITKEVLDLFYLSPTRARLYSSLTEFDLPLAFRWADMAGWANKIAGKSRRSFVEHKVAFLKASHFGSNLKSPKRRVAGGARIVEA